MAGFLSCDSSHCQDTAGRCQHWLSLPAYNTFTAPREHISHRNHILEVWVRVRGSAEQMRGRLLISAMACAADPSTLTPLQGGTEDPCVSVCPRQEALCFWWSTLSSSACNSAVWMSVQLKFFSTWPIWSVSWLKCWNFSGYRSSCVVAVIHYDCSLSLIWLLLKMLACYFEQILELPTVP